MDIKNHAEFLALQRIDKLEGRNEIFFLWKIFFAPKWRNKKIVLLELNGNE